MFARVPNPRFPGSDPNDLPLDEAMGYATHIIVRCRPPIGAGFSPCGRHITMRTEELYALLPKSDTLGKMKERLYCKRCKMRGWVEILPAGR